LDELLARAAAIDTAHVELASLAREDERLRQALIETEAEARALHDQWLSATEPIARLRLLQVQIEGNERATLAVIQALLTGQYGHLA